jgi:cytolysin-activating lysine-acyltransferase
MLTPLSVVKLMQHSDVHKNLGVSDICRRFIPPIELSQYVIYAEGDDLKAFASIGFFSDRVSDGFKAGTHKIQAEDWNSGPNIWLADVIAPFGHARQITRSVRTLLCGKGYKGHRINFRRNYGGSLRFSGVPL